MVRNFCVGLLVGLFVFSAPEAQAGWGSWGSGSNGNSGGSGGSLGGSLGGGSWGSHGGIGLLRRGSSLGGGSWGGSSGGGSWGGGASWGNASSGGGSIGFSHWSGASSGGSSGGPGPIARLFHRIHANKAARRAYRVSHGSMGRGSSGGGSWGGSGGGSSWGGSSGGSGWTTAGFASSGSSGGGYSVSPAVSGSYSSGEVMTDGYISEGAPAGYYDQPTSEGTIISDVPVEGDVIAPSPSQGSTMRSEPILPGEARRKTSGILSVSVPEGAKVRVNGMETKSTGSHRRYVTHGLKPGQRYRYLVEATMEQNGEQIKKSQTIFLTGGRVAKLDFGFDSVETSLTLKVPANAKVFLSGNATQSSGSVRRFATRRLAKGQKWGDYVVRVDVDRNGKTITQEQSVTLSGGDRKEIQFDFSDTQLAAAR